MKPMQTYARRGKGSHSKHGKQEKTISSNIEFEMQEDKLQVSGNFSQVRTSKGFKFVGDANDLTAGCTYTMRSAETITCKSTQCLHSAPTSAENLDTKGSLLCKRCMESRTPALVDAHMNLSGLTSKIPLQVGELHAVSEAMLPEKKIILKRTRTPVCYITHTLPRHRVTAAGRNSRTGMEESQVKLFEKLYGCGKGEAGFSKTCVPVARLFHRILAAINNRQDILDIIDPVDRS